MNAIEVFSVGTIILSLEFGYRYKRDEMRLCQVADSAISLQMVLTVFLIMVVPLGRMLLVGVPAR